MQEARETVYEHVAGDKTFTVTAAERWSANMILRLQERCPDEVEIVHVNPDGSIMARIPLSWMRIKPKKQMSDEQREAASIRMRNLRNNTGENKQS